MMIENQVVLPEKDLINFKVKDKVTTVSNMFKEIKFNKLNYYPSREDISLMKSNLPKYSIFILWLLSNVKKPKTEEEYIIIKELEEVIDKYMKPKQKLQ